MEKIVHSCGLNLKQCKRAYSKEHSFYLFPWYPGLLFRSNRCYFFLVYLSRDIVCTHSMCMCVCAIISSWHAYIYMCICVYIHISVYYIQIHHIFIEPLQCTRHYYRCCDISMNQTKSLLACSCNYNGNTHTINHKHNNCII